jgi:uncharacterized protein
LPPITHQVTFGPLNSALESASAGSPADGLCLVCGLCCNGVIFADVRLQANDDLERLRLLGLPLVRAGGAERPKAGRSTTCPSPIGPALKFVQPCPELEGCTCRIYADRPRYCREFECVLLKSVRAGHTQRDAALRVIRTARRRADEVLSLLRQLGNREEQLPLATRFRQTAKQVEAQELDEERAELYGRLTLVVHGLNVLLAQAFYPGVAAESGFAETVKTR